jgi:cell division protein FtsL
MALVNRPSAQTLDRRIGIPGVSILAAGFVAAAALLPVAQTSITTETGAEIRTLELQRADIRAQINTTQAEVAGLASIERIDREARERLGMAPAGRSMYVTVTQPPPSSGMPARFLNQEQAVAEATITEPWWRTVLSKLPKP